MPLTDSGAKVMSNMQSEYGAKKGKSVFYAKANKDKSFGHKMHKTRGAGKARAAMKGRA
jgi:hypothetical protein